MTYFILWVVFLVSVILSVPLASFLENRGRGVAMEAEGPGEDGAADPDDEMVDEIAEDSGEALVEVADDSTLAGDDFAAFEEIR